MADEVLMLKDVPKTDVPADLQAETYFDFEAHPFAHKAIFDETNSVYSAILGIDDYATKWLADTIGAKKGGAKVLKNETPNANAHVLGNFEIALEEGAICEPSRVIGSVAPVMSLT